MDKSYFDPARRENKSAASSSTEEIHRKMRFHLNRSRTQAVKPWNGRGGNAAGPVKTRRKNKRRIRREYEENTKGIRREYDGNTLASRYHRATIALVSRLRLAGRTGARAEESDSFAGVRTWGCVTFSVESGP